MKTIRSLMLVGLVLLATTARAEYLEIEASEIATIEPTDKSEAPRILVKWDLPKDLDKKIIDGAVVTMTVAVDGDSPLSLDVMPMTTSWSASTAAWSSGWSKEGGDFADSLPSPALVTDKNGGKISADVYPVLIEQIAGNLSNFGFIIVPDKDSDTKSKAVTANNPAKLADAKLIIAYRNRR
jgi:hypothetical protein